MSDKEGEETQREVEQEIARLKIFMVYNKKKQA